MSKINTACLKPFVNQNGKLVSYQENFHLVPNEFVRRGVVEDNEDMGGAFSYDLYQAETPTSFPQQLLEVQGQVLLEMMQVTIPELTRELLAQVFADIKSLNSPRYEIWHQDHNVSDDVHLADEQGTATRLLDLLKRHVSVIEPPVNHNKVSSKPEDRFGLNHFHIDSFEGMRADETGHRRVIDRYFFNLWEEDRDLVVGVLDPEALSSIVPIEYKDDLLKELVDTADRDLPLLKVTTPKVDLSTKVVHVLKIRATHVLHGEYGPANDLLAIVNTVPHE